VNSVSVLSGLSASEVLSKRYGDVYKVARGIVAYSKVIKVIAIIIGGLIALRSIGGFSQNDPGFAVASLAIGIGVAVAGFIAGVLIAAAGQFMYATIDTAVNSSPLITVDEKSSIIVK